MPNYETREKNTIMWQRTSKIFFKANVMASYSWDSHPIDYLIVNSSTGRVRTKKPATGKELAIFGGSPVVMAVIMSPVSRVVAPVITIRTIYRPRTVIIPIGPTIRWHCINRPVRPVIIIAAAGTVIIILGFCLAPHSQ